MTDDLDVLSCPFCGGEAHLIQDGSWYVKCECGTEGPYFYEDENKDAQCCAVAAWNRRAPSNVIGFCGKPRAYEVITPEGMSTLLRAPVPHPAYINIPLYKRVDRD